MPNIVIVGGGISGLSAAYYLKQAGIPSTIVESRPALGGVIQTHHISGCTLELGPDSFLSVKPAAGELIREVGLGGDIIGSNDHLRVTYILRHGKLVPLPDGLMMMVPTRIAPLVRTPLLGWSAKIRMGFEYLRKPATVERDRSVSEFIAEHYGQEALEYLAEPLLSGVYGGDPALLSASSVLPRFVELEKKYGSLTRGVLKERSKAPPPKGTLFQTLKGGLGSLIDALRTQIEGSANVIRGTAEATRPGGVRVNGEWLPAEHIVLACPAYAAAALLPEHDAQLSGLLARIDYSSSLTLSLVYDKATFGQALHGFGFLVPKKERQRLVACTWVQNKFSHRVPDDKIVLRCFFGGSSDEAILGESDKSILSIARTEIQRIMGVTAEPVAHSMARWPRSMAQYNVGHQALVAEIEQQAARLPGVHLAGNAYSGIGLSDCIRTAREAARNIAATARVRV